MKASPPIALRVLDFTLAAGSLFYGMYAQSWFWTVGGLLGLTLAWLYPAKRIRDFLSARLRRPKETVVGTPKSFPSPPSRPYERRLP
jgi:hypothetical protein